MAAAGGRDTLSRVRVIGWSGRARVLIGMTPVDLLVEARIEPFVRSRADTWLANEGRSAARTVMIERDGGFLVHDGAQTNLPLEQALLQRQQMGVYGYLLLAPAIVTAAGPRRLNAGREGYPPIELDLDGSGRIVSAKYTLAASSPDGPAIRQHLIFGGTVAADGIRFPRTISIVQDGRPSQRTTIDDLYVDLAP